MSRKLLPARGAKGPAGAGRLSVPSRPAGLRFLAAALCLALALLAGPKARALAAPLFRVIAPGQLTELELGPGGETVHFSVATNSVFDICLFPVDETTDARAELWRGRERVAAGEGLLAVSERLRAGADYYVVLTGTGRVRLEIARHALSRCFDQPMALDAAGDAYAKAIAREGDVHWYAVTADSDLPATLAGVPQDGAPALTAQLFDARGHLLAEATRTTGGAFLMDFVPAAGETFRVRVSAADGGTGLYRLWLERFERGALPDVLTLSRREMTLAGRSTQALSARLSPARSNATVFWESSDPAVARVSADGRVTGVSPGTAVVTAYGAGGVSDRCRVEVTPVPVAGLALREGTLSLRVGDAAALEARVLPSNASEPGIVYDSTDALVASVDDAGRVTALSEGVARVTARSVDGGYAASVDVVVESAPRRLRALLVGEQNYASTVAAARPGSANSVTAVRSMLGELDADGIRFETSTLLDASRDGILAAIGDFFAPAAREDLSLFYITCHGYYADGMTCFQMSDGSILTASELAQALRTVPGDVLAILDCCGSGGAIGEASGTGDILDGILGVFDGTVGPAAFTGSRCRVLASAALEQDSYRLSFNAAASETDMATAFARALCDAGGWSIERGARGAMRADVDYDGGVTLTELAAYTSRRVMWYLDLAGQLSGREGMYAQSVKVYPEGDITPIFTRSYGGGLE